MRKKVNLNNYIWIKLDSKGEEILAKYYNHDSIDEMPYRKEPDGTYRFQIWEFADIFGGHSASFYAPYSCLAEIEIDGE